MRISLILSIMIFLLTLNLSSIAQDVIWVGQFSSSKDFASADKFSQKVIDFIFGDTENRLMRPVALVARDTTKFWILDQGAKSLLKIDKNENDFQSIENQDPSSFPSLVAITKGPRNKFYFTDSQLNKIFILGTQSALIKVLNDSLILDQPTGIAYSAREKELWVSETGKHRLVVMDETGKIKKTIGKRGKEPGEFNFPTLIWIDKNGMVFVVDAMNFRVQVLDRFGKTISVFGQAGDGSGNFASPKGIAVDSKGNIFVVDALFHTVQVFDMEGNYLSRFGVQGRKESEFWMPTGIYIDENDYIYVSDSYNGRIQIFKVINGN
jgi:DNA-binding beta-propeller fold protein YncE